MDSGELIENNARVAGNTRPSYSFIGDVNFAARNAAMNLTAGQRVGG